MKFGGGSDNYAADCMGDCTGTCETCALKRTRADLAEAVRLLRMVRWEGHLTAMVCPACSVSMGDTSDEHPPGDCDLAAFLARMAGNLTSMLETPRARRPCVPSLPSHGMEVRVAAVKEGVIIVSRETFAELNPSAFPPVTFVDTGGVSYAGVLVDGVSVLPSHFCPTWGAEPTAWRRFVRRHAWRGMGVGRLARWALGEEKRMRIAYRMEMP